MSIDGYTRVIERTDGALVLTRASQAAADPAQRGTEFRPVDAGETVASGETLLVEAYAIVWIILFVFLFMSWRRQGRIDARIAELEQALATVRGSKLT